MEIGYMDFFLGSIMGACFGAGVTLAVVWLRRWLGYSEAGRLLQENRQLQRRLADKDRHITRMLAETERLAEKLGKTTLNKENPQYLEAKAILALTQEEAK
jgi:hypothetical protein